jgi:hypothetical protein
VLGKVALSVLKDDPGVSIGGNKGRPFWVDQTCWVPTYHPAYVLRNRNVKDEVASHFKLAMDLYEGKLAPPDPKTKTYHMERGCLILDHEGVSPPHNMRELPTFTLAEWSKIKYTSEAMIKAAIEAKKTLGAEVVN